MEPQPANNRVTPIIPTTQPAKNPKRAAEGKAIAAKTKQAREEQKRALLKAHVIIANKQLKEQGTVS